MSHQALDSLGSSDSLFYDALGREVKVETAAGFLRRTHYHPWYLVAEDENDTLHELAVS